MLKIRLYKIGKRNAPSYRVVVKECRSKRGGKYIESIGYFNPSIGSSFSYNKEKFNDWVNKGAQPTEAVLKMIKGKYEYNKYQPKKVEQVKAEREKEIKEEIKDKPKQENDKQKQIEEKK